MENLLCYETLYLGHFKYMPYWKRLFPSTLHLCIDTLFFYIMALGINYITKLLYLVKDSENGLRLFFHLFFQFLT